MVDFHDTPTEAAFRSQVRGFLHDAYDPLRSRINAERPAGSDQHALTPTTRVWFRKLSERGWIAPSWPAEYGGAGMSIMEQFIFNEEMAEARAVRPGIITVQIAGGTIVALGTDEQKQEHLPPILSGEVIWCQGYSEPGAGSDLAGLQTRAVRDGDDWIINGQKIWTSGARHADWMILLARSDPDAPKHKGITYFIVDMHAPGVSVRPLVQMTNSAEFNEVYFEDVRVPHANVLGEVNRGWYGAVQTLDIERSSIGAAVGQRQALEDLVAFAKQKAGTASLLQHNPLLRYELADLYIAALAGRLLAYRVVSLQSRGRPPNAEASIAKLYTNELNQRLYRTAVKLLGLYGQLTPQMQASGNPELAPKGGRYEYWYLRSVANTIEGGTSEVQRNIIAARGLGLPKSY